MATTVTNRVDWQLIWAQRGFRDVLGDSERAGAGSDSDEPVYRRECRGARGSAERHAHRGRFRGFPLQHGGHRGNLGDRWRNVFRVGLLPVSSAARVRLTTGESKVS